MKSGKLTFRTVILVVSLSVGEGWWKKPAVTPTIPRKLKADETKTPVIIVPGLGGSQIVAKLDKPSVPDRCCAQKTSSYFPLWLQTSLLVPSAINCWTDNFRLVYDEKTNTVKNAPGVETRVPGFGSTDTIEHMDTTNLIPYFKPTVDALVSWGYERGVSVRGAPYDFRYGPESASEYFTKLKKLIEETYSANGNKKITLMSHSLGSPYTLFFLNKQSQDWKDMYILQWITLNGAFGGMAMIMTFFSSGCTYGVGNVPMNGLDVRDQQRTSTSNAMLMPSPDLWSPNEVLVKTSERNYTVNDYEDFFKDIGFPLGIKLRKLVENLIYPLTAHAPHVQLHCLYGTGVRTVASYVFEKGEFPDHQPKVIHDDGDGTVNRRSLEACSTWIQRQDQSVSLKIYHLVNHGEILNDNNALNDIKTLLF